MARVIDHRKNPTGGPRPSQTWALVDPRLLDLLKRKGAIRAAPPPTPPAPDTGDDTPSAPAG
jgi:hypothetical protein